MSSSPPENLREEEDILSAFWVAHWEERLEELELLVQTHGTAYLRKPYAVREDKWGDEEYSTMMLDLLGGWCDENPKRIKKLLELDPTLLKESPDPDSDMLPIHLAAKFGYVPLEILQLFVQLDPESPSYTVNGMTPLHVLLFGQNLYNDRLQNYVKKAIFLLQTNPSAATLQDGNGETPLHRAARINNIQGDVAVFKQLLHKLHELNPQAVQQKNKQGNLPLSIALKQKPVNKDVARTLLSFYDPEPTKNLYLFRAKSSFWVEDNYSEDWRDKWLLFKPKETKPRSKRQCLPTVASGHLTSSSSNTTSILAEEAIVLALPWIGADRHTLGYSLSCTNKFLRHHVSTLSTEWASILENMDSGLPKQDIEDIPNGFPEEFIDPRNHPDYINKPSYEQAMLLGNFQDMIEIFFYNSLDEHDAQVFLKKLLAKIRRTAVAADDHDYFQDEEESEDIFWNKPKSLEESLERCTLPPVKHEVAKWLFGSLVHEGLNGWLLDLVDGGWKNVCMKEDDFAYVKICHEVAGLGMIFSSRKGFCSYEPDLFD